MKRGALLKLLALLLWVTPAVAQRCGFPGEPPCHPSSQPAPAPSEPKSSTAGVAEELHWTCFISDDDTVWAEIGTPCLIRRWAKHNMTITANYNTWTIQYIRTSQEKTGSGESVEVEDAIVTRRSQYAYKEYGELEGSIQPRMIDWYNKQILISASSPTE
jgi:hypothetical protein